MSSRPNLSENAIRVLRARYLRRDAERKIIETPEELFERVAAGVAHAELLLHGARQAAFWRDEFLELLASLDFLPNSPTLMNAGTPLGQLSACFVLPVGDSMEEIFAALREMALIQRTGGGTGFSFSRLRPRGATILSTGGQTPGPVSFMKIFDCATEHIKLGGKRRGANMGILRVDHPDILEFITSKVEDGIVLRNFNISVGATDAFMEAVREDRSYDLVDPRDGRPVKQMSAREVFERIVDSAWRSGDPGLVFLDTINRAQPTPHLGEIEATNPCGEIPLLPYESCNLGSINLSHMVREGKEGAEVDWEKLGATVRKAFRFLDDVIEVSRYPVPEIERMTRGNRKIGLGVMGFADLLIRLGISYDSDAAVELGDRLMSFVAEAALEASRELAGERGVYPHWPGSRHEQEGLRVRNATRTAIAPTGTISIIAGTSPSIEPLFAVAYRRRHVLEEETLEEVNPLFREHLERRGLNAEEILPRVLEAGSLKDVAGIPEDVKRLFATALEIPWERHLQIQAAFQRHVDNSVSKTINMPEEATPDDVRRAYWQAWELGLKGITIFRYGSKGVQVLEMGAGERGYQKEHGVRCDPTECRI
ncbi:MAG TPA: adenosylcobalamin-dependent ribonucleoside-diphosphate reductase [Longimicrobiales bacterium]